MPEPCEFEPHRYKTVKFCCMNVPFDLPVIRVLAVFRVHKWECVILVYPRNKEEVLRLWTFEKTIVFFQLCFEKHAPLLSPLGGSEGLRWSPGGCSLQIHEVLDQTV